MIKGTDIKIDFSGGNFSSELCFHVSKDGHYLGESGSFLCCTEEIDRIVDTFCYEREIRIKFYAIFDFTLSRENIKEKNLKIHEVLEKLSMFGIGASGFTKAYAHLFS